MIDLGDLPRLLLAFSRTVLNTSDDFRSRLARSASQRIQECELTILEMNFFPIGPDEDTGWWLEDMSLCCCEEKEYLAKSLCHTWLYWCSG